MDLRIGFILGVYYSLLVLIFLSLNGMANDYGLGDINATTNIDINSSALTEAEIDRTGLFAVGVSFERIFAWTGFTVFLPDDSPSWFLLIFGVWQSLVNIFTVFWALSSLWDG